MFPPNAGIRLYFASGTRHFLFVFLSPVRLYRQKFWTKFPPGLHCPSYLDAYNFYAFFLVLSYPKFHLFHKGANFDYGPLPIHQVIGDSQYIIFTVFFLH